MVMKGQDDDQEVPQRSTFEYVLDSCENINKIKEVLGVATVTCATDPDEIVKVLNHVKVANKVIYGVFDPQTYT